MNLNHIAKWLVTVGALNWGLVGVGSLAGTNLNIVNLILGGMPMLETLVYVLVGASAVYGLLKK